MAKTCDAVFEGGGVKGIGLVGAAVAVAEAGYQFSHTAGSSAGAIVASLLAAGYSAVELRDILSGLDYRRFRQRGRLPWPVSLWMYCGVYRADAFEEWLAGLLAAKGVTRFGDLRARNQCRRRYTYRFQAIASNLTEQQMLVLPGDLSDFGLDPDEFPVAAAVRMSMSLPLYYRPVRLTDGSGHTHIVVDGGLLSNYPVWLLDDGTENPPWPTFGFKFDAPAKQQNTQSRAKTVLPHCVQSIAATALDAHDKYHISRTAGDHERTILIPTTVRVGGVETSIRTTDFDITAAESDALFQNGYDAALRFLAGWSFGDWRCKYRRRNANLRKAGGWI